MTMRRIDIHQATGALADYAATVDRGPIVVTRSGRAVAVVVAVDDADLESMALAEDPRFQALIERSMRHYHEQGGLTLAEVERELGIDHP